MEPCVIKKEPGDANSIIAFNLLPSMHWGRKIALEL